MTVTELKEFKRLKKAKKIEDDLLTILRIVELSLVGLSNYEHYVTVPNAMRALNDTRTYLNIHLQRTRRIIENNGKIE